MTSKSRVRLRGTSLVDLEPYEPGGSGRRARPRLLELTLGAQGPSHRGERERVLVLRLTVEDDGTQRTWTVKTFSRTRHEARRVEVMLDILSEPGNAGVRVDPGERELVVTVRPDLTGAPFEPGPYEVVVRSSDARLIGHGRLVFLEPSCRPTLELAFPDAPGAPR